MLDKKDIPYSDYGTAFAKDWHQIFFHDPEGNIVEVHQEVISEQTINKTTTQGIDDGEIITDRSVWGGLFGGG